MNFFEIINACLLELNYKPAAAFESLTKLEHKKLKSLINRVNNDICASYDWEFRLLKTSLSIPKGSKQVICPISSKISSVYVDKKGLSYEPMPEVLLSGASTSLSYSIFHNTLLFPEFDSEKTADIYYLSDNFAVSAANTPVSRMTLEEDVSILPMPQRENLLVYGSCLLFKANPTHPKYKHWYSGYIQALSSLRANSSPCSSDSPRIVIR